VGLPDGYQDAAGPLLAALGVDLEAFRRAVLVALGAGFGNDGASFQRYLTEVASTLRALADEAAVPVAALPELVGRSNSTPPKLIDEYDWVVSTRGCLPPIPDEVLRRAQWARLAQASGGDRSTVRGPRATSLSGSCRGGVR
jgi:hypothetical protein